jgi:hypothetical protein
LEIAKFSAKFKDYIMIVTSVDYTFNSVYSESGKALIFSIEGQLDVLNFMTPYCALFKSDVHCNEAMDGMMWYMYGFANYTPRLPNRTPEDFTTSRATVVRFLIDEYKYTRYLEIGCDLDIVFSVIRTLVPVAVGVDPFRGGTLRTTSDAFFASNTEPFDIAFTDGDHTARQTLLDVDNALKILSPGGTIVLHDCNPRYEYRQYTNAETYNGDVWKVVAALRGRPDIEVVTIDVDHGVGVVRKRPNRHPLPMELQAKLVAAGDRPLDAFTYAQLEDHRDELLRLVTVAEFREWLRSE